MHTQSFIHIRMRLLASYVHAYKLLKIQSCNLCGTFDVFVSYQFERGFDIVQDAGSIDVDILKIKVERGRDLKAMDAGGFCDPVGTASRGTDSVIHKTF